VALAVALALLAGAALGALATALWARRRAREQRRALEEARRRLEHARAAREVFFDLTTHELRSPLSAILGYQELLRDGAYGTLGPDGRDAADRLGRAARHLLNLIDGVIELSRMRTGEVPLELDDVDPGVLLSSAAEAFQGHATERGIEPSIELPDAPPGIRTDRDRLIRALDLLVTSAVRHPAGSAMTFRAEVRDGALTVALEPTAIDVDPATEDVAVRVGIRLAVVARIAELLGGELELEMDGSRARRVGFRIRSHGSGRGALTG
jgi:signal transduction histidine kinase